MSGIVADGAKRLRKAIEAEVRRNYATELAKPSGFWKRALIDQKIRLEVNRRLKNVSSPGSLYFARRLRFSKWGERFL
jgi:hypothetical protein